MTRLFTEDHEWIDVDGDVATVGITDHAQEALGDLVFVDLPKIGSTLKRGEIAATVESVKAASEVYAPIDGEVVAVNEQVSQDAGVVNRDATGDGWLYKLRIDLSKGLPDLMDEAAYLAFAN